MIRRRLKCDTTDERIWHPKSRLLKHERDVCSCGPRASVRSLLASRGAYGKCPLWETTPDSPYI